MTTTTTKPNRKSSPTIRIGVTLLAGVSDDESVWAKLRGTPHIVRLIFILATNERRWRRCIRSPKARDDDDDNDDDDSDDVDENEDGNQALYFTNFGLDHGAPGHFSEHVKFPPPSDININMMPFILADDFADSKLPMYLKPYWRMIRRISEAEYDKGKLDCLGQWAPKAESLKAESEFGKVCFLTIHESFVDAGSTQRRPGLHVDCAGVVKFAGASGGETGGCEGAGDSWRLGYYHWGFGGCYLIPRSKSKADETEEEENDDDDDEEVETDEEDERVEIRSEGDYHYRVFTGGIYMASTIDASCRAWNCKIIKDKASGREVIGKHGDIELLRNLLPPEQEVTTKGHLMYWMTDRTPHEALPLKKGTYRQFFRLVTSRVSLWFQDHSTPNPNGVKPDPQITKIVKGSKFDEDGVVVLENPI